MGRHSVEELLPKADWSIYRLVRMAALRALELSDGKKCLAENPTTDKVTTMALEEISQGRVVFSQVANEKIASATPQANEENDDEQEKVG